jgi:hypothetical protein
MEGFMGKDKDNIIGPNDDIYYASEYHITYHITK